MKTTLRKRYSSDFKAQIVDLFNLGKTVPQLAEEFGVGNSTNWHVYRDDGDETYSCKYGEGGIYDKITNPMEDYVETYQPSGEVRQTCMCVPNLAP
jgi:hypothetical protein